MGTDGKRHSVQESSHKDPRPIVTRAQREIVVRFRILAFATSSIVVGVLVAVPIPWPDEVFIVVCSRAKECTATLPLSCRFAFPARTVLFHFLDVTQVPIVCDSFRRHYILTSAVPPLVTLIPSHPARSLSHILLLS